MKFKSINQAIKWEIPLNKLFIIIYRFNPSVLNVEKAYIIISNKLKKATITMRPLCYNHPLQDLSKKCILKLIRYFYENTKKELIVFEILLTLTQKKSKMILI